MKWKILVNDGMEAEGISALRNFGFEVDNQTIPQDKLNDRLNEYHGIIVRSATKVRQNLIDQCPNLRFIARGGVGMDNIDVDYALSKNIAVINTPAASSRSVAELAMAHILSITRGLHISNRKLTDNTMFASLKKQMSSFSEVKGKTLFLIGFGRIGKELSKMAIGCEMNVVVYDPYIDQANVDLQILDKSFVIPLNKIELNEGLQQADYISIHTPFVGKAILDEVEFNLMKKNTIVINTSRGENINETALLRAIETGTIRFAGMDVFHNEPHINHDLLSHDSISVSPHIGASTNEAQSRIAEELVDKIISVYNQQSN